MRNKALSDSQSLNLLTRTMRKKTKNKLNRSWLDVVKATGSALSVWGSSRPPRLRLLPSVLILMSKQFNGGETPARHGQQPRRGIGVTRRPWPSVGKLAVGRFQREEDMGTVWNSEILMQQLSRATNTRHTTSVCCKRQIPWQHVSMCTSVPLREQVWG